MPNWKGIIGTGFSQTAFDSYCHELVWTAWRESILWGRVGEKIICSTICFDCCVQIKFVKVLIKKLTYGKIKKSKP
jgi:hypothetical protein